MTIIVLVRHGENDWVKEHRLAGWTPGIHLNKTGKEQASDVAERLASLPIRAVYSSPLERCWETATFIAESHNLALEALPAIGEVDYGTWQGAKIKELTKLPEWHTIQFAPSRFHFPDGESLRGVQARAVNALETLCEQHVDEMIVVVSHADVIKLILAHYLGMHIDLFQRIGLAPASVSVLGLGKKGGVHVLRINDDGPLKPPPVRKEASEEPAEAQEASDSTPSANGSAL